MAQWASRSSEASWLVRASTLLAPKDKRAILVEILEGDLAEASSQLGRANTYFQFFRTSIAFRWMVLPRAFRLGSVAFAFFAISSLTTTISWLLTDSVSALALVLLWHYFDLRKKWARRIVAAAALHLICFGATTLIQNLRVIAFLYHLHSPAMERQYAQTSIPFFAVQALMILLAVAYALLSFKKREFGERELFFGLVMAVVAFCLASDLSQVEYALRLTASQVAERTSRPIFLGHEIRGLFVATAVVASALVWRGANRIRAIKGKRFAQVVAGGQS